MKRLKELYGEIHDLSAAFALLEYDQQTGMPAGAETGRADQMATLSGVIHREMTSAKLRKALEKCEKENYPADSFESAFCRKLRRKIDRVSLVPEKLVKSLAMTTAAAHSAWLKARECADYAILAPELEKIIELKQQYAALFGNFARAYDALLDEYEPGMTSAELDKIFAPLAKEQRALVQKAMQKETPSLPGGDYSKASQLAICRKVVKAMGYDFSHGRIDLTEHPFTTNIGLQDVRITTAVYRDLPISCLLSTVHECGHALYEQGIAPQYHRTPLGDGVSYGFHESQSRLWENLVGRSKPFWQWLYPEYQRCFKQLRDFPLEDFFRAVNQVRPSEIRTEADEATYNLHILVRFELEKELFSGKLAPVELRDAWNGKMEKFLGITPRNDRYGVLQDIHWPLGDFGYFPTYALGNLIASQIWLAAEKALPQLEKDIAAGNFKPLRNFLKEKVHSHGARYSREQLLENICGDSHISAQPFLEHLQKLV